MATLERPFEDKLAAAVLPDRDEAQALGEELRVFAQMKWEAYAQANDFDIEHIWRDARGPEITTGDRSVNIRLEWPFSALFEFGVDPHVIAASGSDMLAFPWPEMEGEEFGDTGQNFEEVFAETWPVVFFPKVNWGSKSGGIPKARAVRDMLQWVRGERLA